jgi:hypothetical protein
MKKWLLILMLALLVASVVVVAGCGDSGNWMEVSLAGTYQSDDGKVINLRTDGTFESDAWGSMQEGTWMYTDDEMGKWVDLAFDDGSSISMSAMIVNDEVAAIVDDDSGIQYTRK